MFDFLEKLVHEYEKSQYEWSDEFEVFMFMFMHSGKIFWTAHFIAMFMPLLLFITVPIHLFYNKCMEQVFADKTFKEYKDIQKEYAIALKEEEKEKRREAKREKKEWEQYLRDIESGKIKRYDENDCDPYPLIFNEKTGRFEKKKEGKG
jgi:hypothetical protein